MASSVLQPLQGLAQSIPKYDLLKKHPVAIGIAAAVSAPLLYIAHADYRAWLRLGRAGLPSNAFGWLIQLVLTPLRAPRFDTSCYNNPNVVARSGPTGGKAYLSSDDVPEREGPRPTLHHWILPHRQADSQSSTQWKERGGAFLGILAQNYPSQLVACPSVLERGGPALMIQPQVSKHAGARGTRNEIAHLHPLEGSMHVSLAPRDALLVIERGWGERFGLSGSLLPVTYILVYAPRPGDREAKEAEIVERILTAGAKFMLGEQ